MEAWDKPGPGWWLASDRRWYPPELHPDVVGRWWEHPAAVATPTTRATAPAETTLAVLDRPIVHIPATPPPSAPEPVVRRPDGGIIDLTQPYPHYPAVSGPISQPFATRVAASDPIVDLFPPLDAPTWADPVVPRTAPEPSAPRDIAPTARTTTAAPRPSTRPARPPQPGIVRRAVAKAPVASGALAAVTVAAVGIGGIALMAQAQGSTRDDATAPIASTGPRVVSVYELDTNMCVGLDDTDAGAIADVLSVPCESAHSHRVAAMVAVGTADAAYDPPQILLQATEACGNELSAQGLVDARYVIIQPSSESWTEGDRRAICLVEEGTE